jgi:signal transduction histidine kinase
MDSYEYETADGTIADRTRELGPRSRAGAPIIVDAHVWGVALVGTSGPEPLPSDIEGRIAEFADLVATAIANTATREELLASRARIVAAADDARRRIERNLHDGAQQRLVALGLELRAAEACVPDELQPLKERIAGLVTIVTGVSAEVQEISRGLHPAICPGEDWPRPSEHWPAAAPFQWTSTSMWTKGCQTLSKSARTTSWPRR